MVNSKSHKLKKVLPNASTKKRKLFHAALGCVLIGLLGFIVVNRFTSVEYNVKVTTDFSSTISQPADEAKIHVESLSYRRPILILSSGKGLHSSFAVKDIRVIPMGWQKYSLTINTEKKTFTSDAIGTPHDTKLQVKIVDKLPKGDYKVILNMNTTNRTSLFTVHGVVDKTKKSNKKITKNITIK